ncbi:MAG: hypothetical protein QOD39_3229, partial [Mycobacterium sp.]|nr:hypothetical protein [Mycobacterium sp.]
MTDQSPPGNYPPPPPPPSGYPPPQAPGQALPKDAYTPWLTRVLAWIIDYIPAALISGIGVAVLLSTRETACIDMSEY